MEEHADISTRRRSAMLDIPHTTLQRISRKKLGLYPYRITKKHAHLSRDVPARLRLANWYLRKDTADDDFVQNIWFTDEANFHLVGAVNSHNAVHWGSERPDQVQQIPVVSKKPDPGPRTRVGLLGYCLNSSPLSELRGWWSGVRYLLMASSVLTSLRIKTEPRQLSTLLRA